MSPVRLNGSTSGYSELSAPAVAGNNTITLPTGAGSANQFLKNGATAGSLGYSSLVEDSSGRLGIGTTTPDSILDCEFSGENGITVQSTTSSNANITLKAATSTATNWLIQAGASVSNGLRFYDVTAGTERARIDSSGNLLIGVTSSSADCRTHIYKTVASGDVARIQNASGNTGVAYIGFRYGTGSGTETGYISTNGTSTTYNTSSDYRLKENITPLTGAINRVNNLQVRRFNFIANPEEIVDGFIAHEAQAVVPECVTGEKDAVDADGNPVMQGIDQSKLVPLLTAALQEAIAKIETQGASIAALEARLTALEVTP